MSIRIPVAGPWITQKEVELVAEATATSWYGEAGTWNAQFEEQFAKYVGRRFAISLPSCTSGIHLSLAALGVGPGDEVIVPDLTWIASAAPITYVGAQPVFVDIDKETWCVTPQAIRENLSERTKAIITVDLYGGMPDVHEILDISNQYQIPVIEDAAEAIGSTFMGRRAGSFGSTSVFSFHGSKTLTTGEGGMVVTDDETLYHRMLSLSDHGRPRGDRLFRNVEVAYKYRMSAMQAALGLAQLHRIDELVNKKRQIFNWYECRLSEIPELTINSEPAGTTNSYWMVTALFDSKLGMEKEAVMKRLDDAGIDSRPFFNPLSSLVAYENNASSTRARHQNQVSYALSPFGVNLPSALSLVESQVDFVCRSLRQLISTRSL